MSIIRPLLVVVAIVACHSAVAEANGARDDGACKAMAATMPAREAEIAELTASRDAAAEAVEANGDTWEDLEIHRLASSAHAAAADRAKAEYDDARKLLARREVALQATLRQFNDDVAVFNSRCATK